MLFDFISAALVTLLVTLDPFSCADLRVADVRGMTRDERRRVSDAGPA